MRYFTRLVQCAAVLVIAILPLGYAQPQPPQGKGGFGPGGPGGGPMGQHRKLLAQFDKDGDGKLNKEEYKAAREFVKKERESGGRRGFGGPRGGFGPGGGDMEPAKPGPHVDPADVKNFPDAPLYDPAVLRTVFLEFEGADWEEQLADFYHTDIGVPATLTVDGKKYPGVGVRFRGASSYFAVPAGHKRSLHIDVDYTDEKQRVHGYKTLILLNSHEDPAMMSTVLYSQVCRQYLPAPKANFAKVVINGESWGVYVNAQNFNKEFIAENFPSAKGARWKVTGSPGGGGGLEYVGDKIDDYRRHYEIKSSDDDKSWHALITLCKTLNETPPDKLEAALKPMLDLDGLLWFLALDISVINCDGYWIRASDYSLFRDEKGIFHVIPHDMNECFRPPQGPGFGGGGGPGGGMVMRMGAPGEILPGFLQDQLRLTDEQRKHVADLQKEVTGKLEKILSAEQVKQLKDMRDRGPGGFAMGGGPGGGPPGMGGGPGRGGPGMGGGNVRGVELDPLYGLDDPRKPLRSKILAVPALKERYLRCVRTIAEKSLDWSKLGPIVAQYRTLIEKEVEADTRKLDSFAEFQKFTSDAASSERPGPGRGPNLISLRAFADQRRKYLLNLPSVKAVGESRGTE